jgi:hypothetical protein
MKQKSAKDQKTAEQQAVKTKISNSHQQVDDAYYCSDFTTVL